MSRLRCRPSRALITAAVAAAVTLGCASARGQSGAAGFRWRDYAPRLTDEVLFNPGMGLYLQYPPMDSRPSEWFMKTADIAYYRLHWTDVNPREGVYEFDKYFGPKFDFWVKKRGKRLAFGVMSQSMHGRPKYVTPKWVFDKGVPGVKHTGVYGQEQINPAFWNDRYLEIHCAFIARLGKYLDGRDGLEFMDIRGIGEWGEMHLARWTPEQLEKTGYTADGYVAAYRKVIDAFARAFPKTRVFLNVGGQKHQTINDYAALKGMHFRQDGLKPGGASYNCGEWLFKPYARRGVICNFEFHSGYGTSLKKGWSPEETIKSCLAAPVSYLNTGSWLGGGGLRTAPKGARDWLTRAARKLGHRFVMTKLRLPADFGLDGRRPARMPLMSVWRNDGVAPCYESYALEWSLHDAAGAKVASSVSFPSTPTTAWSPGEEVQVASMLRVPAATRPGRYRLKVSMVLPETGSRVMLGIAGRDGEKRYDLCDIAGARRQGMQGRVYEEGFEQGTGKWSAVKGMSLVSDRASAHGGKASLLVSGTQVTGWNYAACTLPTSPVPSGKYRLSVWMLVEQIKPAKYAPYVKIGVNGADGSWLANFRSNSYDVSKLNTWQRLETVAEMPVNVGSGVLAIEKGVNRTSISARIRLDDVRLELLEGP